MQMERNAKSRGATGAMSELLACAHLMGQGFYVYRCESPHAPFDLVAYRDGICTRVEVKTLSMDIESGFAPTFPWPRNLEWDLLVVVAPDFVFEFPVPTVWDEAIEIVRKHYGFGPRDVLPCGTPAGYGRHQEFDQEPCAPCATAYSAHQSRRIWAQMRDARVTS